MKFLQIDQRRKIARLFAFLQQAEHLALDCSRQQAELFEDPADRRFLLNQSHQEAFHARVFKAGAGMLAPRGAGSVPGLEALRDYRILTEEALRRGNAIESLLAMQVVFEGLGEVLVKRIDTGFDERGIRGLCRRVRHLVVGQEDAHHRFGVNRVQRYLGGGELPASLLNRGAIYIGLLEQLIESASPLFDDFDESAHDYEREFNAGLPPAIAGLRA